MQEISLFHPVDALLVSRNLTTHLTLLQVDGGIQSFTVLDKTKTDVIVEVVDGGEFK